MPAVTCLAPCGTISAYRRHLRRDEQPDRACLAANTAATQRYRETGSTHHRDTGATPHHPGDPE
jgi:hypothetical protein